MNAHPDPGDVTRLLERVQDGDSTAANELLPLVYDHLRATAHQFFRRERAEHTLQPTALVHEAYVKLIDNPDKAWMGREHFCAVASLAMRQILTDYARSRGALKRGGGRDRAPLTNLQMPESQSLIDALVLEECLEELTEIDPEGARIVELRFFGGLSHTEIGRVLGMSVQTVDRRWRKCRALIRFRLKDDA